MGKCLIAAQGLGMCLAALLDSGLLSGRVPVPWLRVQQAGTAWAGFVLLVNGCQ